MDFDTDMAFLKKLCSQKKTIIKTLPSNPITQGSICSRITEVVFTQVKAGTRAMNFTEHLSALCRDWWLTFIIILIVTTLQG